VTPSCFFLFGGEPSIAVLDVLLRRSLAAHDTHRAGPFVGSVIVADYFIREFLTLKHGCSPLLFNCKARVRQGDILSVYGEESMKLEAYVIEAEDKVLVVREEQSGDVMNQMGEEFDPSSDVQISEHDPRLNEVMEANPHGDAYELITTISIY
jgi:hypothetical protein